MLAFIPVFTIDFFSSFFNVGPSKEDIFLTTFYDLYFSHHYTYYKLRSFTYARAPNTNWNYIFVFKFE